MIVTVVLLVVCKNFERFTLILVGATYRKPFNSLPTCMPSSTPLCSSPEQIVFFRLHVITDKRICQSLHLDHIGEERCCCLKTFTTSRKQKAIKKDYLVVINYLNNPSNHASDRVLRRG